jgi:antitoxin component of MazEF toxin-antitoxin module
MVTLPKHLVDLLGVREGDLVQLNVDLPRKDFFGALRGIGRFKEDDRAEHA